MPRPIVFGTCPQCAGQGRVPSTPDDTELTDCVPCGGSGQLYEYQLYLAWRSGYDQGLRETRQKVIEVGRMLRLTLDGIDSPQPIPTMQQLKMIVGLRGEDENGGSDLATA